MSKCGDSQGIQSCKQQGYYDDHARETQGWDDTLPTMWKGGTKMQKAKLLSKSQGKQMTCNNIHIKLTWV